MRRVANADATRRAKRIVRLSRSSRDSRTRGEEHSHRSEYPRRRLLHDFASFRFIEQSTIHFSKIFARARAIYLKRRKMTKQCCCSQERDTLHTRREIFNGNELSRNGKVDSLIFPGMLLSRRIQWNRVEKGTESRAHLCHFT